MKNDSCKHGVIRPYNCIHCNDEMYELWDDQDDHSDDVEDDSDYNLVDIEQY